MADQVQHQQITPLTAEAHADQGLAYLKYQQALLFDLPGFGVFNALTVMSLIGVFDSSSNTSTIYVPNVNGRPVKMTGRDWHALRTHAVSNYYDACKLYGKVENEVMEQVKSLFSEQPRDTEVLLDDQD